METIRYGAGGMPMPAKVERKVEPVEKPAEVKKESQALQEILEVNPNAEDGFDEEVTGEENEDV
jgi:hypothetical protein|tara:strand:- start:1929 stop:2120 length:192 start_codon:yes stop_codon:yes gene_type:complete